MSVVSDGARSVSHRSPWTGRLLVAVAAAAALAAAQIIWQDPLAVTGVTITVGQVSRPNPFVRCISPELTSMVSVEAYSYCDTAVEPRVAVDPRTAGRDGPIIVGVRFPTRGSIRTIPISCRPASPAGKAVDRHL